MLYSIKELGSIKSSEKINGDLIKYLKNAYEINYNLFNNRIKINLNIVICNNEDEWKKESKYYYSKFSIGTVLRDGTLVIKSFNLIDRSKEEFKKVLIHEMNHVFFAKIYGLTKPVWIQEGLANFISNQPKPIKKKEVLREIINKNISSKVLKYRYLSRDFSTIENVRMMYSIWFYFIEYLSINRNNNFLVEFMDKYLKNISKKNYNFLIEKHLGKRLDLIYDDFLIWIKK